ncbi:MAG: hypothetical protein Kow0047_23920 [Anaerolineae bacterium]
MRARVCRVYSWLVGLAGVSYLISQTRRLEGATLLRLGLFFLLSLVIKRLGVRIDGGYGGRRRFKRSAPVAVTHSLVGVVDLAALLAHGVLFGAWVAALSEVIYLGLRRPGRGESRVQQVETAAFNGGLKAFMAFGAGQVYLWLGGSFPLSDVNLSHVVPLVGLFITWFVLDHVGWSVRVALDEGWQGMVLFLRRIIRSSLWVELLPLPASLVIAVVYTQLGGVPFALLFIGLIAAGIVVRRLMETQSRLREQIADLSLLADLQQDVQNAQLDVEALCELVYAYAARVVDASDMALDLYDREAEVRRRVIWTIAGQRHDGGRHPWNPALHATRVPSAPLLVRDRFTDAETLPPLVREGSRSGLYVPLVATGDLIGLLSVESSEVGAFTEDDLRRLTTVAGVLAVAIENAWLYERERRRAVQLLTVSQVSRQVAAILDLEELFQQVVQLIKQNFHYDHVQVFTCDPDHNEVVFRASTSPMSSLWRSENYRLRIGREGIIGWVAAHKEPLLVNDVTSDPRYVLDRQGALHRTRAELAVPLMVEDRVLGVLDVQSNVAGAFTREDLFLLQTLADQIAVAIEDARLYQQAIEQERIRRELGVARKIQASLLPDRAPELPGWEIAFRWEPARNVAGDFFDFIELPDGRLGILIADVSDKGVPAALFMAVAHTLLRALALDRVDPADALSRASDLFLQDTRADMFVTAFYGVLDPTSGQLTYANAGHLPPLLCRNEGEGIACLLRGGIALGVVPHLRLTRHCVELAPGDLLVLYTDGISEAIDGHQREFGDVRLADLVVEHARRPASAMAEAISLGLRDFCGDQPIGDDWALVVLKRLRERL